MVCQAVWKYGDLYFVSRYISITFPTQCISTSHLFWNRSCISQESADALAFTTFHSSQSYRTVLNITHEYQATHSEGKQKGASAQKQFKIIFWVPQPCITLKEKPNKQQLPQHFLLSPACNETTRSWAGAGRTVCYQLEQLLIGSCVISVSRTLQSAVALRRKCTC